MINFKQKTIDEKTLFTLAAKSFYDTAAQIADINLDEYNDIFCGHEVGKLEASLARVSYAKNFEIEGLFSMDDSSEFHIYVMLHVYVNYEKGNKEILCTYTLMLDNELKIVDNFIG